MQQLTEIVPQHSHKLFGNGCQTAVPIVIGSPVADLASINEEQELPNPDDVIEDVAWTEEAVAGEAAAHGAATGAGPIGHIKNDCGNRF